MTLEENLARVRKTIAEHAPGRDITLVAVTKTRTAQQINALYDLGVRDIGENRVQEWRQKQEEVREEFRLHQIGQLQTNKVKYLLPRVHLIQSVDRIELVEEIERRAAALGITVGILLQVNTAREEQKAGVYEEHLPALFDAAVRAEHIALRGLMCIAPLEGGRQSAGDAFAKAKVLFDKYRAIAPGDGFACLSMGMSGDYDIALDCGATMIRTGRTLYQ